MNSFLPTLESIFSRSTVLTFMQYNINKNRLPESASVSAVLAIVADIISSFKPEKWSWDGLLCWSAKTKWFNEKLFCISKSKNANRRSNCNLYSWQQTWNKLVCDFDPLKQTYNENNQIWTTHFLGWCFPEITCFVWKISVWSDVSVEKQNKH